MELEHAVSANKIYIHIFSAIDAVHGQTRTKNLQHSVLAHSEA